MNENPLLTLELTLGEINAVIAALQELPAKICNPLTAKITEQAQKQLPIDINRVEQQIKNPLTAM